MRGGEIIIHHPSKHIYIGCKIKDEPGPCERVQLIHHHSNRIRCKIKAEPGPWEGAINSSSFQARVVHGSDGPAGRVGSGRVGSDRVGSRFCRILASRVGSALRAFEFFLLIISWFLNRYESSNTTLRLIVFLRYLI